MKEDKNLEQDSNEKKAQKPPENQHDKKNYKKEKKKKKKKTENEKKKKMVAKVVISLNLFLCIFKMVVVKFQQVRIGTSQLVAAGELLVNL